MENKLVKFESQLEKVSNQIVITRKLLPDNLDYLKWWSDLDELWKTLLRTEIGLKITGVDLKAILRPDELTNQEKTLLTFKGELEDNTVEVKLEFLKYFSNTQRVIIGRQYNFKLADLKPLTLFRNLEHITFINAEIEDIGALKLLKNLKSLDFSRAKVSNKQIEDIRSEKPNCKIML